MQPETKFEFFQDVLKYIYKTDIQTATNLLSNIPFKLMISETNLVKSAMWGLKHRRFDCANYAIRLLAELNAPNDFALETLDRDLKLLQAENADSSVLQQIESHQQSESPSITEQSHFPDLSKYSPAIILTNLLIFFLCIGIVIQFIGLKVDRDQRELLNRVDAGQTVSAISIENNDSQRFAIVTAFLINTIFWYFFLLVWMRRRYLNLTAFGTAGLEHSERWAWLGFLIPYINIWRPHQVSQEIWRASDPDVNSGIASHWKNHSKGGIATIWWFGFISTNLVNAALSYAGNDSTVEGLLTRNSASHLFRIILIFQFILTITFALKLSTRQRKKYDTLRDVEQQTLSN